MTLSPTRYWSRKGGQEKVSGTIQQAVRGGCYFRTTNVTTLASHRRYLNPLRRNAWVGFRICVY